jgi:hypothetical protein
VIKISLSDAETMYNFALGLIGEYEVEDTAASRLLKQNLLCIRYYELARDETLRAHPWNEAKKRVILYQYTPSPVFGYDRAYAKPTDCLRVLSVDDSIGSDVSYRRAGIYDWGVEGDYILSDAGATPPSWSSDKDYIDGQFFSYDSTTYEVLVTHTSDTTGADSDAQIAVDVAAENIKSKGGDYRIIYVEYIWQETDIDNYSATLKYAIALNLASKIITGLTNDTKGKQALIDEYNKLVMPMARSYDGAEGKPRPMFSSEWIRSRQGGSGGWYVT